MAVENPRWGYTRIRGALANLGHEIGRNTVKRILFDYGIAPVPERSQRTPWKTFLQAHWAGLAASDLFTVEVLTLDGSRTSSAASGPSACCKSSPAAPPGPAPCFVLAPDCRRR